MRKGLRTMLVCSKCFYVDCKCNKPKIDIDKWIIPHIRTLNEKGYITRFCCSGHSDYPIYQCYISFVEDYNFDNAILPDGFVYLKNLKTIEYIISEKQWEHKSPQEKWSIMVDVWNRLLDWCNSL